MLVLVSPLMTRLYSPEEIGIYTFYLSWVNLLAPIVCTKLEMAIVTESSENKRLAIIKVCLCLNYVLSILATCLLGGYLFFSHSFTLYSLMYLVFFFLTLLFNGFYGIGVSYHNRYQQYEKISKLTVQKSIWQSGLFVVLGMVHFSVIGLMLSQLISLMIVCVGQTKEIREKRKQIQTVTVLEMKQVVKENQKFIRYTTPSVFLNLFSYSSLTFFITDLYGAEVCGFYAMSYRLLGMPLTLISSNVAKVFLEKATKLKENHESCVQLLRKTTKGLLLLAVPMVMVFTVISPPLFSLVFGEGWQMAGKYVQLLAWMFGIRLVVSSLTSMLIVAKKQHVEFSIQALFAIDSIIIYRY